MEKMKKKKGKKRKGYVFMIYELISRTYVERRNNSSRVTRLKLDCGTEITR